MLSITKHVITLIIGCAIGAAALILLPGLPQYIVGSRWNAAFVDTERNAPSLDGDIAKTRNEGMMLMARAAVQAILNDPYSAKFESMRIIPGEKSSGIVCGLVNAKNGFGAYIGAKPFVYERIVDAAMIANSGDDVISQYARERVAIDCYGTTIGGMPPAAKGDRR